VIVLLQNANAKGLDPEARKFEAQLTRRGLLVNWPPSDRFHHRFTNVAKRRDGYTLDAIFGVKKRDFVRVKDQLGVGKNALAGSCLIGKCEAHDRRIASDAEAENQRAAPVQITNPTIVNGGKYENWVDGSLLRGYVLSRGGNSYC
jgi:hypothetical protein